MNNVNGTLYLRRISEPDAEPREYQAQFAMMGRISDENVFSKSFLGERDLADFLVHKLHLSETAGKNALTDVRDRGKAELPGLRIEENELHTLGMEYTKIVR